MYLVLAYYYFLKPPTALDDPHLFIKRHLQFLQTKDARGRIYVNEEGINGQMSIHEKDAEEYIEWLHSHPVFCEMDVKVHLAEEHAFAKMTVKYRKQLAALNMKVDVSHTAEHVPASQWKQMLENKKEDTILIDVRNRYESMVGHFEGAILPDLETFRDFGEYVEHLKTIYDMKKTKVMMYCTGGIRCELYSALMKEKGFDHIYQLEGGVIKYGLEEGVRYWKGKLFVFDDRMVVPISQDPVETISHCKHCDTLSDVYYNCANMDCNALFLACPECAKAVQGCCCKECMTQPRVRAFIESKHPKPFRKLPFKEKVSFRQDRGKDL